MISTIEELEALYGYPQEASVIKEVKQLTPHYRSLIEAAPFAVLATSGPEGLDCSPRGDKPGFIRVHDSKTLLLPDRRGNNRADSLRNIIHDPRMALLFMLPGIATTLRVNGQAQISITPELLETFAEEGKAPRSVMVITIDSIFFQCGRAILRSKLWDSESQISPNDIPTAGQILAEISENRLGGEDYDNKWLDRAQKSLW